MEQGEIDGHLNRITDAIEEYESMSYTTKDKLRELLRVITSEIYFLTHHQIQAKNAYNSYLYEWSGAVARGEILAHKEIPELYQLRYIIRAAQNVVQSIIMEISILNKEE